MIYLVIFIWLLLYLFLRNSRAWLLAYIVGAVGFTTIAVYLLRGTYLEGRIEQIGALGAHYLSTALGIPTRVFFDAPGTLLVLIVYQEAGWTAIEIDIECSGLLEFMVFSGLTIFYEGFPYWRRLMILLVGIPLSYGINIIRIIIIVFMIHKGGKDAIYLAHTVVARAFFFAMAMALYWHIFTRPTLQMLRQRLTED